MKAKTIPTVNDIGQRQTCREINNENVLRGEDQVIGGGEGGLGALEAGIRIDGIGEAIEPQALALVLVIEQLGALDAAQALDESRGFPCLHLN